MKYDLLRSRAPHSYLTRIDVCSWTHNITMGVISRSSKLFLSKIRAIYIAASTRAHFSPQVVHRDEVQQTFSQDHKRDDSYVKHYDEYPQLTFLASTFSHDGPQCDSAVSVAVLGTVFPERINALCKK